MANTNPLGYLSRPSSGNGKSILLLHAWWGLNDTAKQFCENLASEGYTVFAPDLYHGKIATTIPEAEQLRNELKQGEERAQAEVLAAAEYLLEQVEDGNHSVAAIGFSLGAGFALDCAFKLPDKIKAVVLYYGVGEAEFEKSTADYLGHFAENDEYEPKKWVDWLEDELKKAGREVTFHTYPGTGHWFAEPDRVNEYNEATAELAWNRTLVFLREKLS